MTMKKYLIAILFFCFSVLFTSVSSPVIYAQGEMIQDEVGFDQQLPPAEQEHKEETLEGQVSQILEEKQITPTGVKEPQLYQKLEIMVTKGSLKDKKITIENGNLPMSNLQK